MEKLPLFPLGAVLFPGAVLPLHVFEERYRMLVRHLLDQPEGQRRFGVVAITLGHEVGRRAARKLADVGCVAEVSTIQPHPDGRYGLVVRGGGRFRVEAVDDMLPYLRADVAFLPEEPGPEAGALMRGVAGLLRGYLERLRPLGVDAVDSDELPADPVELSYLVASTMLLNLQEKQSLLEAEDATARLRLELELLRREVSVMRVLGALPAPNLRPRGANPA